MKTGPFILLILALLLLPFYSQAQCGNICLENEKEGIFFISLNDVPSLSTTMVTLVMGDGSFVHWKVKLNNKNQYTTIISDELKGLDLTQLHTNKPHWRLVYPYKEDQPIKVLKHVTCNSTNGNLEKNPEKDPVNEFETYECNITMAHPNKKRPEYLKHRRKKKKKYIYGHVSPQSNPDPGDTMLVCLIYRPHLDGQVELKYPSAYLRLIDWNSEHNDETFIHQYPEIGQSPSAVVEDMWASNSTAPTEIIQGSKSQSNLQLKKSKVSNQENTLNWKFSMQDASDTEERGIFVRFEVTKEVPKDTVYTIVFDIAYLSGDTTQTLELEVDISKANDPNNIIPSPRKMDFRSMPDSGRQIEYFVNLENVGGKSEDSIFQRFTLPEQLDFSTFQVVQVKIPANAKPLLECPLDQQTSRPCYKINRYPKKNKVTLLYRNFNLRGRGEEDINKKEKIFTQGIVLLKAHTKPKDQLRKLPIKLKAVTIFGRDTANAVSTKGKTRYRADFRLGLRLGLRFSNVDEVKSDSTYNFLDHSVVGLNFKPYHPAPYRFYPEIEVNLSRQKIVNLSPHIEQVNRPYFLEGTALLRYNFAPILGVGAGMHFGQFSFSEEKVHVGLHQWVAEVSAGFFVGRGIGGGLRYYRPRDKSQEPTWEVSLAIRL